MKSWIFLCDKICLLIKSVSTSNHMFGRAIRDKLLKCIFENFEIARVKLVLFQNIKKSPGWFIPQIARTKHVNTR